MAFSRKVIDAILHPHTWLNSGFLGMFAPRSGANIPKNSFPFPILWEGGRGMGVFYLFGKATLRKAVFRT
jgi:hypothetical protein